jgi:hypothetical protein
VHDEEPVEDPLPVLLAALLQAAAAVPPEKVDLTIPQPCGARRSTDSEIVVCGHRGDGSSPYRIAPSPPQGPAVPKAEMQVADGVKIAAEAENANVGGFPSDRFVLRLKVKF